MMKLMNCGCLCLGTLFFLVSSAFATDVQPTPTSAPAVIKRLEITSEKETYFEESVWQIQLLMFRTQEGMTEREFAESLRDIYEKYPDADELQALLLQRRARSFLYADLYEKMKRALEDIPRDSKISSGQRSQLVRLILQYREANCNGIGKIFNIEDPLSKTIKAVDVRKLEKPMCVFLPSEEMSQLAAQLMAILSADDADLEKVLEMEDGEMVASEYWRTVARSLDKRVSELRLSLLKKEEITTGFKRDFADFYLINIILHVSLKNIESVSKEDSESIDVRFHKTEDEINRHILKLRASKQ